MRLLSSHLDYFKSLLEGTAEVSWHAWFRTHEAELREALPRAAFLRLKFSKLEEAEKHLQENKVAYRKDPVADRREKHFARLSHEVLDDRGRPLESFRRAAYDGAFGKLMDGDTDAGRGILEKFVQKVRRFPVQRRQEEIESLCFDGEMEVRTGDPAIGRVLLEAVVTLPPGNDLTDYAVKQARALLNKMDLECSRRASFPVAVRMRHDKPVQSIRLGPCGLLVGSTRDGLFLWDINSGKPLRTIHDFDPGAHQAITDWDLSPDGQYLCTGMADLTTKVYATGTGERLVRLSKVKRDFFNSAEQIRFSPAGRFVATAIGRKIEVFSVGDWERTSELKGHTSKVHELVVIPGTSILISAGGRYVKFWDVEQATELLTLPVFPRMLGALAVSDDGSILVTATEGGEVSLWSLPDGKTVRTYAQHTSEVFGVAISPDKSLIASSELNGQLNLWQAADGQTIQRLTPGCGDLVFSPDGKLLSIVAERQTWIIRAADGKVLGDLGESFFLEFLGDRRVVCGDGNDVVVREILISDDEFQVAADRVERTITAARKKVEKKPKPNRQRKPKANTPSGGTAMHQTTAKPHFWLHVRRELQTLRLFHSKPDRKAVRPEFADLACSECNKVDELAALQRGVAAGVKPPPDDIQLAMTDDGILLVSSTVRSVLEDVARDDVEFFDFPDSDASIVWPRHILCLPEDAPLRTGTKPQTTVLAVASPRCLTCHRPRHVTVRPSRGQYEDSQMIVGLSLEPGFWFVAHASVGDALKAARITGWRREEFGSSPYS